jgi:hypothetical protein
MPKLAAASFVMPALAMQKVSLSRLSVYLGGLLRVPWFRNSLVKATSIGSIMSTLLMTKVDSDGLFEISGHRID